VRSVRPLLRGESANASPANHGRTLMRSAEGLSIEQKASVLGVEALEAPNTASVMPVGSIIVSLNVIIRVTQALRTNS
jgi:hypothetical protein